MSPKISTFSAQLMTVRGDITVERSPAANPTRVIPATATMPPRVSASALGTRAETMPTSASGLR